VLKRTSASPVRNVLSSMHSPILIYVILCYVNLIAVDSPVHHNCYVKIFYPRNHLLLCTKSFCLQTKIRNERKTHMAKLGWLFAYSRSCIEINILIRKSRVKSWIPIKFQYQMFVLLHTWSGLLMIYCRQYYTTANLNTRQISHRVEWQNTA